MEWPIPLIAFLQACYVTLALCWDYCTLLPKSGSPTSSRSDFSFWLRRSSLTFIRLWV